MSYAPFVRVEGRTAEELEREFNPRLTYPDALERLARWSTASAEARTRLGGALDLAYGPAPGARYDEHAPAGATTATPLVIFVHGGYWRALDKADHSFVAPPLVAAGCRVANLNYTLCPEASVVEIIRQVRAAVAHLAARYPDAPRAIMGHSAGAHLAAMVLNDESAGRDLRAALLLSGIYHPAIVRLTSVNAEVGLDAQTARDVDALHRPPRHRPSLTVACGEEEPASWIAMSETYVDACRQAGHPLTLTRVTDADHFSILERAAVSGSPLLTPLLAALGLAETEGDSAVSPSL